VSPPDVEGSSEGFLILRICIIYQHFYIALFEIPIKCGHTASTEHIVTSQHVSHSQPVSDLLTRSYRQTLPWIPHNNHTRVCQLRVNLTMYTANNNSSSSLFFFTSLLVRSTEYMTHGVGIAQLV